MKYKTIDDLNVKGKTVLVRVDVNSEIVKGKVVMSDRIRESAKTIKELSRKGARVVVLAHQGQQGKRGFIGLRGHARLLNKFVNIGFVDDVIGKKAVGRILKLKNGESFLLDNVRFVKDEVDPKGKDLVNILSRVSDYFVNDAFSVSHRRHQSIIGFPRVLESAIGRVMEKELNGLRKLKVSGGIYVLGGIKTEGNVSLIGKKKILSTGYLGLLALKAKGYKLGSYEKVLKSEMKYLPLIKRNLNKIETPIDLGIEVNGKRQDIGIDELPTKYKILDIGPKTVEKYTKIISKSKSVFFRGSAGFVEDKIFAKGTVELYKAMMKSKGFTVVGGGHSISVLEKFKISKSKFNYVSLSGGALVNYIAGKKLPGLEVLRKR
jgi:phosphoglycerate kinase